MRLEDALEVGLADDDGELFIPAVAEFLYDGSRPQKKRDREISQTAHKRIAKLKLDGDDFEYLGLGSHSLVVGNDKVVFKLDKGFKTPDVNNVLSIDKIPDGLSARILLSGKVKEFGYSIHERLDTKRVPQIGEIISYLFKAKEKGVTYTDCGYYNFGFDKKGVLKVLDHVHFYDLNEKPEKFCTALDIALDKFKFFSDTAYRFPLVYSDAKDTFIMLDPKEAENEVYRKKLGDILKVVGVDENLIENSEELPVIRVRATHITYGTPPKEEPLKAYIEKHIHKIPRQHPPKSKEEEFLHKIWTALDDMGADANDFNTILPSDAEFSLVDNKKFLNIYSAFVEKLHLRGMDTEENLDKIDEAFDEYRKATYKLKPVAPQPITK